MRTRTSPPPHVAAVAVSLCLALVASVAPARVAHADPVHIELSDPSLEVWNQTRNVAMVPVRVGRYGTAMERSFVYAPLCPASPCTANMAPGPHALALSKPGDSLLEADARVEIHGESTLTGEYHDRSALRGAGYITLVAGLIGGTALFFASSSGGVGRPLELNPGFASLGAGVFVGSLVTGVALVAMRDFATFTVTPLFALGALGAVGPNAKRESGPGEAVAMNGLALTATF